MRDFFHPRWVLGLQSVTGADHAVQARLCKAQLSHELIHALHRPARGDVRFNERRTGYHHRPSCSAIGGEPDRGTGNPRPSSLTFTKCTWSASGSGSSDSGWPSFFFWSDPARAAYRRFSLLAGIFQLRPAQPSRLYRRLWLLETREIAFSRYSRSDSASSVLIKTYNLPPGFTFPAT